MRVFVTRLVGSRDTLYLLVGAVTMFFLAADTAISHLISGTVIPEERIPIWFGVIAGLLLLAAGALSLWRYVVGVVIAVPVYLAAIVVGLLGASYHWTRLWLPGLPLVESLVGHTFAYVPPVLAPLSFVLVAILGISAIVPETPDGSGRIRPWPGLTIPMPFAKERAYLLMVTLGILIAVVSATLDHAHADFGNPWMWGATAVGVLAAVAVFTYALREHPSREDYLSVLVVLVLLALVGLLGDFFHLRSDLRLGGGQVLLEKFVRGAPPMAPLLYVYMATLGLIAVLPLKPGAHAEIVSRGQASASATS